MTKVVVMILIVVNILSYFIAPLNGLICDKEPSNQEQTLKKHLFCNGYNPKEHPRNVLNVTMYLTIRAIHFTEYFHELLVFTDHVLGWKDDKLKWNAQEWYNITELSLKQDEIWIPKIMTYDNRHSKPVAAGCKISKCSLTHFGMIICSPLCLITTSCSFDASRWPYDTRICKMRISRQTEGKTHLNNMQSKLQCSAAKPNSPYGDWKLMSVTQNQTTLNVPSIEHRTAEEYQFLVQHSADSAVFIVLSPLLVLVMLNFFTCWLSSMMHERLCLLLVSLFCQNGHLRSMWFSLWFMDRPPVSAAKVLIVSYLITFILFAVTLFNRWLHSAQHSGIIGGWIDSMPKYRAVEFIMNADYLSLGSHKMARACKTSKSIEQHSQLLAKLIDRGVLLVTIVVYIILFCVYVDVEHEKMDSDLWCSY